MRVQSPTSGPLAAAKPIQVPHRLVPPILAVTIAELAATGNNLLPELPDTDRPRVWGVRDLCIGNVPSTINTVSSAPEPRPEYTPALATAIAAARQAAMHGRSSACAPHSVAAAASPVATA